MKKIRFSEHILPHLVAIGIFLVITLFFFKPVFFDGKALQQHDIQMFQGSAKSVTDYREQTGEEALWADGMFSGMPAYLISVQWSNQPVLYLKKILSLGLPHPIANIFIAFVAYYIMLLSFRIRPYLAIAGAIAFGLSTYMIVGLAAGHNGRIGAIALMPLVMAGIHLAFTKSKLLGFAVTAAGIALHLRENHPQMTYYLLLIVLIYGLVRLIDAIREKTLPDMFKTLGLLVVAVIIGAGTYFGQFWAIKEYGKYSTRGKSELTASSALQDADGAEGMTRSYAFEFSNGILEPLVLMIPNIYGGSSSNFLAADRESETYKALMQHQQQANDLVYYTTAYWGDQRLSAPYYAGAVIVFLFAIGIAFAESKYKWWLVSVSVLGIVLSWGTNFAFFNYLLFDYLPGYNQFRSVTFTLIMPLFAMPLLGLIGLETLWSSRLDKANRRKLLIAFGATGGLCLVLALFGGLFFDFIKDSEAQLEDWFTNALAEDRQSLLQSDAFRSFAFILVVFVVIWFELYRKISPVAFYVFFILVVTIDIAVVDKRYFTENNYKAGADRKEARRNRIRGIEEPVFPMNPSDQAILQDKSHYRVINLTDNPFAEARTSYYHNSIGGYHGAKLRRYSDFYDSCMISQINEFIRLANQGLQDFSGLSAFNMLNIKYIIAGTAQTDVILNRSANGNAWFASEVIRVNSPLEELQKTCGSTSTSAVVDASKFNVGEAAFDSAANITLAEQTPKYLRYESQSSVNGLAVFSEIYYPEGWIAFVDGKETPVIRVNYILRALEVPAGKHTIEMKFEPKAFVIGDKITMASSWLLIVILLGSFGWALRGSKPTAKD